MKLIISTLEQPLKYNLEGARSLRPVLHAQQLGPNWASAQQLPSHAQEITPIKVNKAWPDQGKPLSKVSYVRRPTQTLQSVCAVL